MNAFPHDPGAFGAWNPGIQSQVPKELLPLSSCFRPANVFTSLAAATELQGLTGFALSELVVFRPERLALHELLIRVTADFRVPDGSRIEDLGINFRAMTSLLLARYVVPHSHAIAAVYASARREVTAAIHEMLGAIAPGSAASTVANRVPVPGLFGRWRRTKPLADSPVRGWGTAEIAQLERIAGETDALQELVARTLAHVMTALFTIHGEAWGTWDLIVSLSLGLAGNVHCSEAIGRTLDPLLRDAAAREQYELLPRQQQPVVINTKGPSASGKSTLRPLQKKLTNSIGVEWRDFALISPDIWRKQLLDYGRLGTAYKYAGALAAEEVRIVDQKLDRYMARKHELGEMSHLLIDRFRFDSFASDSHEAGSNLLTRFGQMVYLFFVITPPELLVERAWKRGLEFGRYKAVDDTLAHAVEAYAGIPDVFFTWARRSDKRLRFEFLDNTVSFGAAPRTVAFGDNHTFNVLDATCLCNIERYERINVDAVDPEFLYPDPPQALGRDADFLTRCMNEFRDVNFADPDTGRIYLRIESGTLAWIDWGPLQSALRNADTLAGLRAAVPLALSAGAPRTPSACFLSAQERLPTLGQWGARLGCEA